MAERDHPIYPTLVERFKTARAMWQALPTVRDCARLLGYSEYMYCLAVVREMGPLLWTATTTTYRPSDLFEPIMRQAFIDAGVEKE